MGFIDARHRTLFHEALRATLLADTQGQPSQNPGEGGLAEPGRDDPSIGSVLTGLMGHGGVYSLLDNDLMTARLTPFVAKWHARTPSAQPTPAISDMVAAMQGEIVNFFSHLIQKPYQIPSNLMSHISFPIRSTKTVGTPPNVDKGVTYSDPEDEACHPSKFEGPIPAAFTFVGQFIDHDLTMNAVNLFDPQMGAVIDVSSPLIDLDSVYGPRSSGFLTPDSNPKHLSDYLFERDQFRLSESDQHGQTIVDLCREMHDPMKLAQPIIADKRNDENQLILQIHLLIMRHHNKLIRTGRAKTLAEAYLTTLHTWQYIVLHDYLPRVLDTTILAEVTNAIRNETYTGLKHVPLKNVQTGALSISMPHEFAIAFRFGHSQLKAKYKLNSGGPIDLFNNTLPADKMGQSFDDLRGGQFLQRQHVIDWATFLGPHYDTSVKGNLIDDQVTSVVFDLPESTIPDDVKTVGNLPFRNLARSRQVGLCSGEDLAEFYGVTALSHAEVEPDTSKWVLYEQVDRTFKTPLWFYILREAQVKGGGHRLGPLGSRLVAEVIVGGIYYNEAARRLPQGFVPTHLPVSDSAYGPRLIDFAEWATTP